jgi:hypothetical protein
VKLRPHTVRPSQVPPEPQAEVDSECHRRRLEAAVRCVTNSAPSLRISLYQLSETDPPLANQYGHAAGPSFAEGPPIGRGPIREYAVLDRGRYVPSFFVDMEISGAGVS